MRALLAFGLCALLGCATTSRVAKLEQRTTVVERNQETLEGLLGLSLKYDASEWGSRLGGPEASEAVASVSSWVPEAVTRTMLGAGGMGGPGLTYPGSLTLTGLTVNGALTVNSGLSTFNGGVTSTNFISNSSTYYARGNAIIDDNDATLTITTTKATTGSAVGLILNNNSALAAGDSIAQLKNNGTLEAGFSYLGILSSPGGLSGTAGSGTGITTNATAEIRHHLHKITVARTALTAAATTQDITLWTIPAKTRVLRLIEDVTAAFDDAAGPISAVTTTCGTSAGGNQYLLSGSVFAVTTLGDVVAEMGAGLVSATLADLPSMSGTTAVQCRWTSTGGNLNTLTTGSSTFYLEEITYP